MKQGTNRFFSFRTAMTLLLALMTTITAWAYDIKTHITYKGLTASDVTFTLSGNGVNFELKDGETKSVGDIFPYADFTISCSSTLSPLDVSYSGTFIPAGGPSFEMNSENGCSFIWSFAESELTLNICVSSSDLPVYTVHFDPNTMLVFGSMNDQIIESGVPTPLSPCTFENVLGLNFCGWNTAANGSGESFADGASVTDIAAAGEAITLYAQWRDEDIFIYSYNIHFDANGGTGSMTDQSIDSGTSTPLTANSFTRDGYNFTGWNTKADGSGTSYANQQSINPTSDMTLYAQWQELTPLTQGGSINMPTSGTKYVEIPSNVTKFYVYDDGGSNGNFSNNCDGKILLVAPVGKMLKVGGSVKAGTDGGFSRQVFGLLEVYDGSSTSDTRLLSYFNSSFSNIVSSDRKMLLHFYDDKMDTRTAEGISLTVEVVEPERNQIIIDSNISHGTVTVDKTAAMTGETVTLTVTPATGYELAYITGVKATSIGNNQYTFNMPDEDVTISAEFRISSLLGTSTKVDMLYYVPDGSATFPYVINSTAGWNLFCDCLEDVDTWNHFTGKTVKLGADIEVSRVAGSSKHDFSGTFDGAGHKLTVNLTGTGNYTAPFYYLKPQSDDESVTIRGLKVGGTINTANKYAGGLVGGCHGKVNIIDCVSDVTINSSVSGDGTHGGLVGRMASSGTLSFDGCAFTGKMLTTNGTANCGGFLGWTVGTVNINNCLYAPAAMEDGETEVGSSDSKAFARLNNTAVMNINNSFYTRTLGTAQGIQAHSTATLPANIGEAGEDYRFVKPYAKGLKHNGLYYMIPEALTLANASANDVESINGYFADVTLSDRTLYKDGKWNTICLPFDVTLSGSPLEGATARTLAGASINGSTLNLTFGSVVTDKLVAGTPYIIKWASGQDIVAPVFTDVTVTTAKHDFDNNGENSDQRVRFLGTYNATTFDNGDNSVLIMGGGNTLYYPNAGAGIGAQRAYFKIGDDDALLARQLTAFSISFGDEVTTGIIPIENGQLTIDNSWYTVDGRRLMQKPAQRGMYINGGKKVIVR